MRIAIYHNLPSGGAKRTLFEETRRLSENHLIDVYTLSSANHEFSDLRPYTNKHQIYDFENGSLFSSPFGRLNQAVRLIDLKRLHSLTKKIALHIDQGKYDVCLVQPCQFETSPSVLGNLNHTPTVYFCQEPLRRLYEEMPIRPYDENDSPIRLAINRIDPLIAAYFRVLKNTDQTNINNADIVLVNSKYIRKAVKKIYGVSANVCYHGVDHEWFQPTKDGNKNYVLSVGSLTPLKGFDFLINALALLPEEIKPRLVIASNFQNPPEKDFLQNLAIEKNVDLTLEGNVSEERLLQLYNQAKLTVYAPIREPFGLVPVESMACETAVLAVRDGGIQETILDGKTGLLVDRDLEKFSNGLKVLLTNKGRTEEYGRNGREYVLQNWTWNHAIHTLENFLLAASKHD
jgi:glycosyltransferase involved in cell wall biosynthesis